MRVVSGERLAFQAGTGDFEHLRPLQVLQYVASSNGGKHPALTRKDRDRYPGGVPSFNGGANG